MFVFSLPPYAKYNTGLESLSEHRLWIRPYFTSSTQRVLFFLFGDGLWHGRYVTVDWGLKRTQIILRMASYARANTQKQKTYVAMHLKYCKRIYQFILILIFRSSHHNGNYCEMLIRILPTYLNRSINIIMNFRYKKPKSSRVVLKTTEIIK